MKWFDNLVMRIPLWVPMTITFVLVIIFIVILKIEGMI